MSSMVTACNHKVILWTETDEANYVLESGNIAKFWGHHLYTGLKTEVSLFNILSQQSK